MIIRYIIIIGVVVLLGVGGYFGGKAANKSSGQINTSQKINSEGGVAPSTEQAQRPNGGLIGRGKIGDDSTPPPPPESQSTSTATTTDDGSEEVEENPEEDSEETTEESTETEEVTEEPTEGDLEEDLEEV